MDDRKLLELAAKAAGLDGLGSWDGMYKWLSDNEGWTFDPLTDDGDASRLEAALSLDVRWQGHHVIVGRTYGDAWQEPFAMHGNDKQAARRYAAVRAAAAIGEQMP